MTMMLVGGALVCAWVFLCLLSTERERSSAEADIAFSAAQKAAQAAPIEAERLSAVTGQREKLDAGVLRS
jgi:hypothetical protein